MLFPLPDVNDALLLYIYFFVSLIHLVLFYILNLEGNYAPWSCLSLMFPPSVVLE